jgi:DNA modification methylase
MSSSALHTLQSAFIRAGGHWSTFIIWAKQTFTLGRSDYQRQFEPILYGWCKNQQRYWCGARDQSDVWFFNKPNVNDLHPTQKPVELVMRAIRNSCERGHIILDCFMGSGSSLIAAERTGRICYGLELDPKYSDTIIRRWQLHTGDTAIHAGTRKTFNELAAEQEQKHV